jgi:hypothetical protein
MEMWVVGRRRMEMEGFICESWNLVFLAEGGNL